MAHGYNNATVYTHRTALTTVVGRTLVVSGVGDNWRGVALLPAKINAFWLVQ